MATFGFEAPAPPPPPPPSECKDCEVSMCVNGRTRIFGIKSEDDELDECENIEADALLQAQTHTVLLNNTANLDPECLVVRCRASNARHHTWSHTWTHGSRARPFRVRPCRRSSSCGAPPTRW